MQQNDTTRNTNTENISPEAEGSMNIVSANHNWQPFIPDNHFNMR